MPRPNFDAIFKTPRSYYTLFDKEQLKIVNNLLFKMNDDSALAGLDISTGYNTKRQ